MQLTEKQLKIQEFADKTLSFGCIVLHNTGDFYNKYSWQFYTFIEKTDELLNSHSKKEFYKLKSVKIPIDSEMLQIIWHPMTYSRLLYFMTIYKDCDLLTDHIVEYVLKNPNVLNETVLERPEYLLDRVIDFLDTLPKE